jgi:hypothetical protein
MALEWLSNLPLLSDKAVLYYTALFGAAAMYIFSLQKGFEGSIPFLKRAFPGRADHVYVRIDFLIVIVFGSIIGFVTISPTNTLQALAAGVGWVGSVNVLVSRHQQSGSRREEEDETATEDLPAAGGAAAENGGHQ